MEVNIIDFGLEELGTEYFLPLWKDVDWYMGVVVRQTPQHYVSRYWLNPFDRLLAR